MPSRHIVVFVADYAVTTLRFELWDGRSDSLDNGDYMYEAERHLPA